MVSRGARTNLRFAKLDPQMCNSHSSLWASSSKLCSTYIACLGQCYDQKRLNDLQFFVFFVYK